MKYTQIKIEEVATLYPKVVIADKMNQILFKGSEDGCLLLAKTIAREIVKLTPSVDYCDDLFKLELSHCIEEVANRTENIKLFGQPWFARENVMFQILNAFEEIVI